MTMLRDEVQYFTYQFDEDDTLLVKSGQEFQDYEEMKVDPFESRIKSHMACIDKMMNNCCHMEQAYLQQILLKLKALHSSVLHCKLSLQNNNLDVKLDCQSISPELLT